VKIIIFLAFAILLSACGREDYGEYITEATEATEKTIRVAIGNSNFMGLVHGSVEISGTSAFVVSADDKITRFNAGEIFEASSKNYKISPVYQSGRLKVIGLERNWANGETPQFRGVMQISQMDGGFIIVNELPLEEYLYAVIPSEMPSSFGVEASKVQAVTARSFAIRQIRENRFSEFGAHVDDSVISQVYNNIPENDVSIKAVRATRGLVLKYEGEIISANYFSTSGGTTANFGEVWANGGEFPVETPSFLRARAHMFYHPGDLRTEAAAAYFFRNKEIPAFEREFPWFRWEVTMTADELSERINENLLHRQQANPDMIHLINEYGEATHEPAETIGILQNIEVVRRGQGGNLMEVIFRGTEGDVRVKTEFNIRALLNPREIPVIRHDGSTASNLNLLPSAFFTKEVNICPLTGELQYITFHGGGNGHGVGMSQNGVRALLDMGLTYVEILRHFYPGTEVNHAKP